MLVMIRRLIGVIFFLFLICTANAQEIEFEEILEIQPLELNGTFITDLDVDSKGFIAVALNDAANVQVFDFDGNEVNTYGKRGRGPGDFTNLMSVDISDEAIYAMDSGPVGRIHAFNRSAQDDYQTFHTHRSPNGSAVRAWMINKSEFLVEFRAPYSGLNLKDDIISSFEVVSIEDSKKNYSLFKNQFNEMFIDRSNGGFSVSKMPFGRKNFISVLDGSIYHVWSGEEIITRLDLNTLRSTKIDPESVSGGLSIPGSAYRKYFLDELGVSTNDDLEGAIKTLSTDPSSRLVVKTVLAKLENMDKLHDTYPVYKWVTGDESRICFARYTNEISKSRVACMDDSGSILGEGELDSDVQIMSQAGDYIAGVRQIQHGLQSVVVYKLNY